MEMSDFRGQAGDEGYVGQKNRNFMFSLGSLSIALSLLMASVMYL